MTTQEGIEMRIDRFTKIVNIENSFFVCNIKTGAIDAIDKFIADELDRLTIKNSFTPLECNLKEQLLEEMINRGYLTYYSEKEEIDERKWLLEKYKEKVKKEEKTISLILDNVVVRNWCYKTDSVENSSIGKFELVKLLKYINNKKLANKIDLWLLLKNRITDWKWIVREVNKNNLMMNSLFTIVKDPIELEDISTWLKSTATAPKVLQVKYENNEDEYIALTMDDSNTITVQNNTLFLNKHPFFCPFIYRTFFIDKNCNLSYCMKKLLHEEKVILNNSALPKYTLLSGWSKELFSTNCEEPNGCIFSIYCSKMCSYLGSINNNRNSKDCNLIYLFNSLLEKKIKSMV